MRPRTDRPVLAAAALLLLLAAAPPPAPPATGLKVTTLAGGSRVDAVLPGRLVATALPRMADGRRRMAALVESASPGEPLRALFLVDFAGGSTLRRLLGGLPGKTRLFTAADLDGDNADELLLGTPDTLWTLGPAEAPAAPRPLLEGIDPQLLLGLRTGGEIAAPEVGRLRTWSRNGGKLFPGTSFDLPVRARRSGPILRLETPVIQSLAQAGGPPLYLAGPEQTDNIRLRTLLLTRNADGTAQRSEAWSRFPAPEAVADRWFARIDGRPFLIVTTMSSNRLNVLEKQKLHVFLLSADRSRAGQLPVLSMTTESHREFPVMPLILDLDRDGREELVVVQQEGARGRSMLVEAFFGQGAGRFERPSRKVSVNTQPSSWLYGFDLTGDSHPDLATVEGKKLQIFAGTAYPRRSLLERRAYAAFDLASAEETVITATDSASSAGRPVIVLTQGDDNGRGRITFIRPGG